MMNSLSLFDIYALFCVSGIGNRKLNRILRSDTNGFVGIDDFVSKTLDEIKAIFPALNNRDAETLMNLDLEKARTEYEQLSDAGVDTIIPIAENYPRILYDTLDLDAPPLLFCFGRFETIAAPAISIVGSRDISERGRELTVELVEMLTGGNITIISGGAKGIDAAAHNAAIECGLNTIVVTPHGINKVLKGLSNGAVPGNALYISQFHPNSNWSAAFAMIRNRTVCALSKAIFVVEAGESGGWSRG